MSDLLNISCDRRQLIASGMAGTLVLAFGLGGCSRRGDGDIAGGRLNAYVSLDDEGRVVVQCPFVEMGQGIYSGIAMLVAEEFDVELAMMRVEQAPPGVEDYLIVREGERFTGADESIRSAYVPLRRAGAAARSMLIAAAADRFGVAADALETSGGRVVRRDTGETLAYGELAAAAAKMPVPGEIALRPRTDFRVLGRPLPRLDIPAKCDGSALFGIDQRDPRPLTAAVRQAPVFGGKVARHDPARALAMRGVVAVEEIPNGIAVLADNFWRASRALDALDVEFEPGPAPGFSSEEHARLLRARLADRGAVAEEAGDVEAAFARAARTLSIDYLIPYVAHVTLEPMCCTALVTAERCTLWAPNQGVDYVRGMAAGITGLPESAVEVHTPYLGGAFGRRFMMDYIEQSLVLAVKRKGQPVKVVWSREEDFRHDFYRPMLAARQRVGIDRKGRVVAWHSRIAGMGPYSQVFGDEVKAKGFDWSVVQGMTELPYDFPDRRVEYVHVESPAPVGFWRTTGYGPTCFFKESVLDETAVATGRDPCELRRELLAGSPRTLAVLDRAAEMARWRPRPWTDGGVKRAHGVAVHNGFGSIVAQVAEVSIGDDGRPRVHKVSCAVDCGLAINPLSVTMQMEGGIAFGLSSALHEEVVMRDGRALPGNFHEYPILGMQDMPEIEVAIIEGGEKPGGAGEIGTTAIVPAVCNALLALTGRPVRTLPIRL